MANKVKTVLKSSVIALVIVAGSSLLAGCDKIGQTPAGGSDAEVKAAIDAKPLEERAKIIMSSPAPQDFKIQRIKELYAKEGKTPPAEYLQGGGPAPSIPTAPAGGK